MILLIAVGSLAAGQSSSKQARGGKARASASKKRSPAVAKVPAGIAAAAKAFVATGCDASLWDHVYRKQRLRVVEKCILVTGTIHHIKQEADGDDHIQLKLDPAYAALLNSLNHSAQAGTLVAEPICQNVATRANAIAACRDFRSRVVVPAQGAHVRVLGSYVLDAAAKHGWMEIHPVTSIVVGN